MANNMPTPSLPAHVYQCIDNLFATKLAHTDLLRCNGLVKEPPHTASDTEKAYYYIQRYALACRLDILRQHWMKMNVKDWQEQVAFLYEASNGGFELIDDDLIPWGPLMDWLWKKFAQVMIKATLDDGYALKVAKHRLLKDLRDNVVPSIWNECEDKLVDMCLSNGMGPCRRYVQERLSDLDKQVNRECLDDGSMPDGGLLDVNNFKAQTWGSEKMTSPF